MKNITNQFLLMIVLLLFLICVLCISWILLKYITFLFNVIVFGDQVITTEIYKCIEVHL